MHWRPRARLCACLVYDPSSLFFTPQYSDNLIYVLKPNAVIRTPVRRNIVFQISPQSCGVREIRYIGYVDMRCTVACIGSAKIYRSSWSNLNRPVAGRSPILTSQSLGKVVSYTHVFPHIVIAGIILGSGGCVPRNKTRQGRVGATLPLILAFSHKGHKGRRDFPPPACPVEGGSSDESSGFGLIRI